MKRLLIVAGLCLGTPSLAQGTMQNAGEKVDRTADATKDTANKAASDTAHATKKAASDTSSATKRGTTKAADSTKTAASKADSAVQRKTGGTEPRRMLPFHVSGIGHSVRPKSLTARDFHP